MLRNRIHKINILSNLILWSIYNLAFRLYRKYVLSKISSPINVLTIPSTDPDLVLIWLDDKKPDDLSKLQQHCD